MFYEYECKHCDQIHEVEHSIKQPPLVICPICGKRGLKRLISKTTFSLSGGCWEKDGYRK